MNFLVLIVREMRCMQHISTRSHHSIQGLVIYHEYYNSYLKGTDKVVKFTGYPRHAFQGIYHYSPKFYLIFIKFFPNVAMQIEGEDHNVIKYTRKIIFLIIVTSLT
jgi:hypothetical protein